MRYERVLSSLRTLCQLTILLPDRGLNLGFALQVDFYQLSYQSPTVLSVNFKSIFNLKVENYALFGNC